MATHDAHDPAAILRELQPCRELLEDFRPLSDSLEWRLAAAHWRRHGVGPFVDGSVPWLVNNTGRLSADAAAVLYANCVEADAPGEITVAEFGAGTGLFASFLLDEFQALCEREACDFYRRLCFIVADGSPATVQAWATNGVFARHAAHVRTVVADACAPHTVTSAPPRAVFCNYFLDSLLCAVVRRTEGGWEQLCVRPWLSDERLLREYWDGSLEDVREHVRAGNLENLLPLLPLIDSEREFSCLAPETAAAWRLPDDTPPGRTLACNYGALRFLQTVVPGLAPNGFVLIHDFRTPASDDTRCVSEQWFGAAAALGLNFPWLEANCGAHVAVPDEAETLMTEARLVHRGAGGATLREFLSRFSALARREAERHAEQARVAVAAGDWNHALTAFARALESNPRDWQLIGEAAEIVGAQLGDDERAVALADAALALNPWYSPWLWNIKGEALSRQQRHREAHFCYESAAGIAPGDARAQLLLAGSWLKLAREQRSLEAIARGLANDTASMVRHELLEVQQAAISALAVRAMRDRDAEARRRRGGLPPTRARV
jgi:tetratricopeptide (TPR) repeat protein